MEKSRKILVTGGCGFLGRSIIKELTSEGSWFKDWDIRVLDLTIKSPNKNDKVEYIQGNINNELDVDQAVKGCEVIIHSAAIVDWGTKKPSEVLDINYGGTLNIIRACKKFEVKVLVYTSSLDAVYTGKPLVDIDESIDYPSKPHSAYCESKALSEKAVVEANSESIGTCVIRPADVWGEGDPYHIGSLIDMSKKGIYVRLGNGKSKCQHVYVGNVAQAHLQAAQSMLEGNKAIRGSKYFITDHEGANFFKFFDKIVEESGYSINPKNLWLPRWFAYSIASVAEFFSFLWRPIKHYNPKFSRFAVSYTCTDFTFNSTKAKTDFDFNPKYSYQESLMRTVSFYRKNK